MRNFVLNFKGQNYSDLSIDWFLMAHGFVCCTVFFNLVKCWQNGRSMNYFLDLYDAIVYSEILKKL